MAAIFLIPFLIFSSLSTSSNALTVNYYGQTCPEAESIVAGVVHKGLVNDKTVPAALLRMHFHDCFIRGCDASVLLDSEGKNNNQTEKVGPPNISLHAFYVIDNAKKELEKMCPGVVSCADILALAARDAVALSGGPTWKVPNGRKDGRVSNANETKQLPFPTFNVTQLQQSFSQRGLSLSDLVALSGGHTLGFSHCSSFRNRIHNFGNGTEVDPTMDRPFASGLRRVCPKQNKVKNAGVNMDSSPTVFDNGYFQMLRRGKSVFSSDQALMTSSETKALVDKFADSQDAFFEEFVKSMVRMSSISGGGGGGTEVRLNCKVVN